jgi:hypothetical protein
VIVVEGTLEGQMGEDLLGSRLVRASINNTTLCRRLLIWGFNDGTALPCSMLQGHVHYCDICSWMSSALPICGARINFTTEMIQQYLPNHRE